MRKVHAVFQNDGEWFIARCLDFPVTTQGKTLLAAKKNLQEAVELYLETWGDDKKNTAKEVYLTSIEIAGAMSHLKNVAAKAIGEQLSPCTVKFGQAR